MRLVNSLRAKILNSQNNPVLQHAADLLEVK